MEKRTAARSETVGAGAIYAATYFLHALYGISGGAALGMVFGAVNESVWEHVKIVSEAYVGWALLQLCWLKIPFRQYVTAKCVGLYALMALGIGYRCVVTAIAGSVVPCADVVASAVIVAFVQWLSYRLTTGERRLSEYYHPALMMVLLYYLMFFSFTVFPPKIDLFRDPLSGGYGIRGLLEG